MSDPVEHLLPKLKPGIPVLPLRDVVVYPHMVIPLFVGRSRSIKALELTTGVEGVKETFLLTQKDPTEEYPTVAGLYQVGTVATVLQMLTLPDGTVKVLVEGTQRGRVKHFIEQEDCLVAEVERLEDQAQEMNQEIEVLLRTTLDQFEQYVKLNKKIFPEILTALTSIDDPGRLADMIAAYLPISIQEKQAILELSLLKDRLEKLLDLLQIELDLLRTQKRIHDRVKKQMKKNQREYYLNEQMKAIQKELGESQGITNENEAWATRIEKTKMSKEAKEKAISELSKLKSMPPMAAEAVVSRNYLESLLALPWNKRSRTNYTLEQAYALLNKQHYGLEAVKERIIEFLAVHKRAKKLKGPILCLVGPPGVGKTSLGQSIAESIGRKFVRVALGGVRDEADIRGHRRTYIGSMPGRIMQKITMVAVKNPLFMLDEIDKMAMDFRGDPASALLEVLDSEQNDKFYDHYLDVGFDLSEVLFIATANTLNIPGPLLDRMEVIRIPGYTEDEKVNIASRYLIPKQERQNALKPNELIITENAVRDIIRFYTREAGVRNLEREIAKICRKVVTKISRKPLLTSASVSHRNLETYLGVQRFRSGLVEQRDQIGQVTGLAWTEVGGELLTIEAAVLPGKGKTVYTGHLGEVMQESIQAALTVVRSRASYLGIPVNFYEKADIHVHVPEGATPKDGPSAGIGMCTALVSALTKNPVRAYVAMTGEITLRGEVLPIGGLKEKLLAALRGGIREVIIPAENKRDLKEIPKNIKQDLIIHAVRWIDEVLNLAGIVNTKPAVELAADLPPVKLMGKKRKLPAEEPTKTH